MRKKINFRVILIFSLVLYMCYSFGKQALMMNKINDQIKTEKVLLQKTKDENSKLQDQVSETKTNRYSEQLAREILGLVKEGETPVINGQNK